MFDRPTETTIRNTYFRPKTSGLSIELLSIESLFGRFKPTMLHRVERIHFYLIFLFTHGSGRHWIDFIPYEYDAHTMLFLSKGQVQQFEVNPDSRGYLLLFTPEFLYENATALNVFHSLQIFDYTLNGSRIALTPDQHTELVGRFVEIGSEVAQPADAVKEEILRHLLRLVLLNAERICRANTHNPGIAPHYQEFVAFRTLVQSHLRSEHSVEYYARQMAITPRKLNTITRQVTGKTAKAWIDEQIILESQRLLAQGGIPIKEIAYGLGFSEPTNMVKFFKKHTRISPSAFRAQFLTKS